VCVYVHVRVSCMCGIILRSYLVPSLVHCDINLDICAGKMQDDCSHYYL